MKQRIGIILEPLDVLFFRDGRSFGAATHATTGLPTPQTLSGALWTAVLERYGCQFYRFMEKVKEFDRGPTIDQLASAIVAAGGPDWVAHIQVRGPWLAEVGEQQPSVLIPAPATLHVLKNGEHDKKTLKLKPIGPKKLPGWEPPEPGMRPLWLALSGSTEPAQGLLRLDGLRQYLQERDLDADAIVNGESLYTHDRRTGIVIQPDQLSAEEGGIYGISFLSLRSSYVAGENSHGRDRPAVGFYAEVLLPDGAPKDVLDDIATVAFGGEGRRASLQVLDQPVQWPAPASNNHNQKHNQKPLLVLTTPGLFEARWKPKALEGRILAAAVPASLAVSGWDLARGGPKPTRFAAPAGSVYFLDSLPENLPEVLADRTEDSAQGWGCFVQGVWTDE